MKKIWEVARPHIVALGIFLVVFAGYFHPQLKKKVVGQSDIQQFKGMSKESKDFQESTGDFTLWTNAMFGGMPVYQIGAPQQSNWIRRFIEPAVQLFIKAPISWFVVAAVCFYILMLVMGVNRWLAIIGGLAFALSTNNMILFAAGHTSKFRAISYLPLALAGVYLLLNKQKYIQGGIVFLLAMSLNIAANHYQMTYYFAIGMVIFMLAYLVFAALKGEVLGFAKSAAIMLIGGVLAIGPSYSKISTTLEYSKDTMRGDSDLKRETRENNPNQEVSSDGLNWDYAMMWSYAPIDLLGTFIPGIVGGSSGEEVGTDYEIARFFGNGKKPVRAPLYWGGSDSTAGPAYFGVIIALLLVIGLFTLPNDGWKIAIIAGGVVVVFLSLGRYFESFNRLLFDHFPKYSSFRAHSSAIGVVSVFFPILAIAGLSKFLSSDKSAEEKKKIVLRSVGIVGGIALMVTLIGGAIFSLSHFKDEALKMQYFQGDEMRYDQFMDVLQDGRAQYLRESALKSLGFVLLVGAILWGFAKSKVKKEFVIATVGLLILIDMISLDRKYLGENEFISKNRQERPFSKRAVDHQILQMETNGRGYYRVLDLSINTFSSSSTSYFHNTVGGYSAVKMSRIQDVIDTIFNQGFSYEVLDMLNTKYIIDGEQKLFPNVGALGNAWFIDSFSRVSTATDELAAIKGKVTKFNSHTTAVIHDEFKEYTAGLRNHAVDSGSTRSISMTKYQPNRLVYSSNAVDDEFVVFSEIWYGPNKGWVAYIDGSPVDHIRVNYLLRGMKIPKGEHEIVFEFKPETFEKGEMVSMASSILILLLLGGWMFKEIRTIVTSNEK